MAILMDSVFVLLVYLAVFSGLLLLCGGIVQLASVLWRKINGTS